MGRSDAFEKKTAALVGLLTKARDRNGYERNYLMDHSFRVAEMGNNESEYLVGLAHDLVADDVCTLSELYDAGLNADEMSSVDIVTRRHNETYNDYITRVLASGDTTAKHVKMHDLLDHLLPRSWSWLNQGLAERYMKSLQRFLDQEVSA